MRTNQETDNTEKYGRGGVEGRLLARFRDVLCAEAARLAPARVLDAGCGEGAATAWLAETLPGAALTGVEARADARAAFAAALPDAWVDQLAITGTPADARARLVALAAAGADAMVLIPAGPDPLHALEGLGALV
jgi:trans-aconitate methyltransferase